MGWRGRELWRGWDIWYPQLCDRCLATTVARDNADRDELMGLAYMRLIREGGGDLEGNCTQIVQEADLQRGNGGDET
jgi:hypothetical protein